MFSRKLCFALLSLSLSSLMAQAAPAFPFQRPNQDCSAQPVSTVIKTVTMTASAAAGAPTLNNGSSGSANQGNNSNGNQANTNPSKGNQTNANQGKGGQNNNNNGNANGGGKGNTGNANASASATVSAVSSAASATSTAVKGGNGSANNGANTGANTGNAGNGSANTGAANNGDPQKSLTLDPKVIATGFANNGQDVPADGQVASLTSTNNFINFCLTVPNLPITNGKQITSGSCNPAPIGVIPSVDNMPSSKFVFPQNFGTVKANTAFTVQMAIARMQTGAFVNAQANYFSAPQQLNGQGQIIGHSHIVIESLSAIDQTTPTDPKKFAFFKGLNAAAVNGVLTADVTAGLGPGFYRIASINAAANHQPAIVPIAQHGSLDDAIYFTVTDDGKPAAGAANAGAGAGAAASSSAAASATSAAVVKGNAAPVASAEATATAAAGTKGGKGANAGNANAGKGAQAASSAAAAATTAAGGKGAAAGNVKGAQATSSAAAAAATSAASGKGAAAAQNGNVKGSATPQGNTQSQNASSNPNVKGSSAPVAGGAQNSNANNGRN